MQTLRREVLGAAGFGLAVVHARNIPASVRRARAGPKPVLQRQDEGLPEGLGDSRLPNLGGSKGDVWSAPQ